jgi:hypothetical protein
MTGPQPLLKWVLQKVQTYVCSFIFHYLLVSLRSSSIYLHLSPRLPVLSFLQHRVLSTQFLRKMWPTQLALFLLYVVYSSPSSLCVILLHFSRDRPKWFSPPFSSTTFQNFPAISDLLSEVSKFQHHTKLWSKHSVSPVIIYIT